MVCTDFFRPNLDGHAQFVHNLASSPPIPRSLTPLFPPSLTTPSLTHAGVPFIYINILKLSQFPRPPPVRLVSLRSAEAVKGQWPQVAQSPFPNLQKVGLSAWMGARAGGAGWERRSMFIGYE